MKIHFANLLRLSQYTRLGCALVLFWITVGGRGAQTVTLDTTFNPGTGFNNSLLDMALQSDGKLVAIGNFQLFNNTDRFSVARINTDGTLDTSFDPSTPPSDEIDAVEVQSDGKVVIGGRNQGNIKGVGRLNTDGSLDSSFNVGTGTNASVWALRIQSDGKIVIGGRFTSYNGTGRVGVARVNSNGSLDTSFDPGAGIVQGVNPGFLNDLTIQSDGKVIIGGNFSSFNGIARNNVARLNSNGSLDTSFDTSTGADNTIAVVVVQTDGKILIGGDFTSVNGTSINRIARLNSDGSIDTSFNPGSGANSTVKTIALQNDGKILIGGDFSSVSGTTRNRVARLESDGTLDSTFDPGSGFVGTVYKLILSSSSRLLAGGSYSSFSGSPRADIARLIIPAGNSQPTLTSISSISGGIQNTPLTISYATIEAAADEADADGDAISFRIESVSSGTLTKGGSAVSPGTTLLSSGESVVWTPASNASGTLNAFTVKAYDGTAASSTALQVQVQVAATASFPITEDFNGKTTSDITSAGWLVNGNATVTGNRLRLTQAVNAQNGSAIYNRAFSSSLGINVQFDYFMGGGTGADGMSFYLLDGSVSSPTTGAGAGALNYTYGGNTTAGVSKGYIGVGFDLFGHYLNAAFFGSGVGNNQFAPVSPKTIGLRGPGTANPSFQSNAEYDYVVGSAFSFPQMASDTTPRKVNLTIKNDGKISMQVSTDSGANWTTVYNNLDFEGSAAFSGYTRPGTFKLGFGASTGGQNNEHSIDNLQVTLPADLAVAFTGSPS